MLIVDVNTLKCSLVSLMKKELSTIGYEVPVSYGEDDVIYTYFVMQKRLITSKTRHVMKSKEFHCPTSLEPALNLLIKKIESGENVNPYLSRAMKQMDYQDKMLFDWGVYHFHLGDTLESDGYMNRTGALLFAMVDEENVYFINVYDHNAQWSNTDILNLVNKNWPELTEEWKIQAKPEVQVSNDDVAMLRKANINTIIELDDGSSLVSPGMGLMANGRSMEAMRSLTGINSEIRIQKQRILQMVYDNPDLDGNDEIQLVRKEDQIYCTLTKHGLVLPWIQMDSLEQKLKH